MIHVYYIFNTQFPKLTKKPNKYFKDLSFWLNENKIALNVAETEVTLYAEIFSFASFNIILHDVINL